MYKNLSIKNMSIPSLTFRFVITSGLFIFALLLPCGFSKEKTEQQHKHKDILNNVVDPNNWSSWTAGGGGGLAWSMTDVPSASGIPLSLEQQEKLQLQKQQSTKSVRSKGRKIEDDINLDELRRKAFKYGKMLFDFVTGGGGGGLSKIFPDSSSFSSRQSEGAATGRAGVVDWLARLIGVQGKSLGEFLREYQVHVLYDLVFTFFKWVFFLYAGLLIP